MARITVEDCLKKVNNRFTLIHMAAKRVRQLRKGAEPALLSKNKDIVVSLREISAGHVIIDETPDEQSLIQEGIDSPPEELEAAKDEKTPDDAKDEKQASDGN